MTTMAIELSEISVYPFKSARGLDMTAAQVEPRGLRDDRRWMLIDSQGQFMSQREHTRMALLDVQLSGDGLVVSSADPNREQSPIALPRGTGEQVFAQVWHDRVTVELCGRDCDAWFSQFLDVECQVVYMPEETRRRVDPTYASGDDIVSLADGFPVLVISQASLDLLNEKLESPVAMQRFRPNLVVTGCAPHEEDSWRIIRIGEVELHLVKPCTRCTVPTIDPHTGQAGKEPIRTLAGYRRPEHGIGRDRGGKVLFGQNAIPQTTGDIRVGQTVEIV